MNSTTYGCAACDEEHRRFKRSRSNPDPLVDIPTEYGTIAVRQSHLLKEAQPPPRRRTWWAEIAVGIALGCGLGAAWEQLYFSAVALLVVAFGLWFLYVRGT